MQKVHEKSWDHGGESQGEGSRPPIQAPTMRSSFAIVSLSGAYVASVAAFHLPGGPASQIRANGPSERAQLAASLVLSTSSPLAAAMAARNEVLIRAATAEKQVAAAVEQATAANRAKYIANYKALASATNSMVEMEAASARAEAAEAEFSEAMAVCEAAMTRAAQSEIEAVAAAAWAAAAQKTKAEALASAELSRAEMEAAVVVAQATAANEATYIAKVKALASAAAAAAGSESEMETARKVKWFGRVVPARPSGQHCKPAA